MGRPETQYAWTGDVALAYQVIGDGPADLVYLPEYASNLEWNWEHPLYARFMRSLASFSRLLVMDIRGTGCSDGARSGPVPTLEIRAEDLLVVLDDIGLPRASILGVGRRRVHRGPGGRHLSGTDPLTHPVRCRPDVST